MRWKSIVAEVVVVFLIAAAVTGCAKEHKASEDTPVITKSESTDKSGEKSQSAVIDQDKSDTPAGETISTDTGSDTTDITKETTGVPMGRYIEETINLPDAVRSMDEVVSKIIRNPDGVIELYTDSLLESGDSSKNNPKNIQYILGKDNKWERTVPEWLNKDNMRLECIAYTADGTKYAVVGSMKDEILNLKLLKSKDNKAAMEVLLEDFEKPIMNGTPPNYIHIVNDNSIILGYDNRIILYENGKEAFRSTIKNYKCAFSGSNVMTLNESGCSILEVNTGKSLQTLALNSERFSYALAADSGGNWYCINEEGIQRLEKENSAWDTIYDGKLGTMSDPSVYVSALLPESAKDFYAMFYRKGGYNFIKHYIYDKMIPSKPEYTLNVASLYENSSIRQAVTEFNQANTDIQVVYQPVIPWNNYNAGIIMEGTIKDNIALLTDTGADILVLDSMPVNAVTRMNILTDISDVIQPLIEEGKISGNIMSSFVTAENQIFAVPIRYKLAFSLGNKEAVAAANSMDKLADYTKRAERPLFGSNTLDEPSIIYLLYEFYSNRFLTKDGFDRNGLTSFLQQLKTINTQTEAKGRGLEINVEDYLITCYTPAKSLLGIGVLGEPVSAHASITAADDYSLINNQFIPQGLIGINNTGKNKELAFRFLSFVLNESSQNGYIGDGFPLNTKAYDTYMSDLSVYKIPEMSRENLHRITKLCQTANIPIITDPVLLQIVTEEAVRYLKGEAELEGTVDAIISNVKAYRNE